METETKPIWVTTREAMGKTWTVELWPDDSGLTKGGSSYGHQRNSGQYLRINANLKLDSRDETLFHELIHTVAADFNLTLNEDTVARLSMALYAFLRGFGLWNEFPWPDKETKYAKIFDPDGHELKQIHPNLSTKGE